ncbi:MAG: hypothetical protein ACRDZR_05000, partial [Acidimicrobiales bacterium]
MSDAPSGGTSRHDGPHDEHPLDDLAAPSLPPELSAVVEGLRSLDEQAWESAVPMASFALPLHTAAPPARPAAAPAAEGRNRWGRGPGRPARI